MDSILVNVNDLLNCVKEIRKDHIETVEIVLIEPDDVSDFPLVSFLAWNEKEQYTGPDSFFFVKAAKA